MTNEQFLEREYARVRRLREFVEGELRNMVVHARLRFTAELFKYLEPEIKEMVRTGKIDPVE